MTIPFIATFAAVLILFDVAGRVVRPFSFTAFEWVMAALQRTLLAVFQMFGTRLEVDRPPSIRPKTGYVIVSNHQSLFDIAIIGGLLFSNLPKYVAKAELGRWIPSVSLNLTHGGHALVDRRNRSQAIEAIADLGRSVQRRNRSAVIFPEGTRSRDGALGRFRRAGAGALLAAADRLPVVPVAIQGSWHLNRLWPFRPGSRVRVTMGEPRPRTADDAIAQLDAARAWIAAQLRQAATSGGCSPQTPHGC